MRDAMVRSPWWFRLAQRFFPGRCKETHDSPNGNMEIRQVTLLPKYVFLLQLTSSEDPSYMHSHPWRYLLVLGLRGRYLERRPGTGWRELRAPYAVLMDSAVMHQVADPVGHTSILIGFCRDDSLRTTMRVDPATGEASNAG